MHEMLGKHAVSRLPVMVEMPEMPGIPGITGLSVMT